jgi:hypothetical protein
VYGDPADKNAVDQRLGGLRVAVMIRDPLEVRTIEDDRAPRT